MECSTLAVLLPIPQPRLLPHTPCQEPLTRSLPPSREIARGEPKPPTGVYLQRQGLRKVPDAVALELRGHCGRIRAAPPQPPQLDRPFLRSRPMSIVLILELLAVIATIVLLIDANWLFLTEDPR